MITKEEWDYNCNKIFALFPPPSNIKMQIDCKDKDGLKHFKSVSEFLAYVCLYNGSELLTENIHYQMKDEKFYKNMNKYIAKVQEKIKER